MATTDIEGPRGATARGERASAGEVAGRRAYARWFVGPPLAIALTLAGVLAPAILVPYAYADDYSYLWMAVSGEPNTQFGRTVFESYAANGRPLTGLLTQAAFGAADSVEHLRFVRVIGVIGVIALALLLQRALTRSRIPPWPAALIALLACTMPAFQVYGSWTVLFAAPYAAVLSGLASDALVRAAREGSIDLRDAALGGALLLAALFIYQPAAMCFWVFLAIALVGTREDGQRAWRLTWLHGAAGAAALAAAYLATRLAMAYYGEAVVEASRARANLSSDVLGRLRWFVEQPLTESLNLFHLGPLPWLAALVAAVTAGGVVLVAVRTTERPWLYLSIAVALVPLSHLPNLAIEEEQHPYRTQAALSALLAVYLGVGWTGLALLARDALHARLNSGEFAMLRGGMWAGGIAVVVASCLFAASNVTNLMAGPQMSELRLYRAQVRALPMDVQRVSFVQTSWHFGIARRFYNDEFGVPTTARPFALEGSFRLLLREQGRLGPDQRGPVVEYFPPDVERLPAGQPAIDLRQMWYMK